MLVGEGIYTPRKTIGRREKEWFARLYDENYSTQEIAEATGYRCNTINRHLRAEGRPVRREERRLNIPFDKAFDKLSPQSAYWGGFIAGDGCVFSRRKDGVANTMTIALAEYDVKHLQNLQQFLRHEGKLTYNQNTKSYSMTVSSRRICKDLEKYYNITPNKTYDYTPPTLPPSLAPYFVLGLMDADGGLTFTLNKKANRLEHNDKIFVAYFDGTLACCEMLQEFFQTEVHIRQNPSKNGGEGSYRYMIQGNIQLTEKLALMLPSDLSKTLALRRKYERYLELKKQTKLIYS